MPLRARRWLTLGLEPWAAALVWAGVAARLGVAFATISIKHPDQHFQTLEPAARLAYGLGWQAWEWKEGTRSWFLPGLYAGLLGGLKLLFGVHGGVVALWACRALTALVSGAGLWGFARVLKMRRFRGEAQAMALVAAALWPPLVAWGPATLSDVWAAAALWALLPIALDPTTRPTLVGVALGLPFLFRIQMAAWLAPAFLCLGGMGIRGMGRRRLVEVTLGLAAVLAFQGGLDWMSWGSPFHSVLMNVKLNLFHGVASTYGTSPWYAYPGLTADDLGIGFLIFVSAFALAGPCLGGLGRMDRLVLAPALVFVGVHSALGHKEARFMLPAYPALLYAAALGFQGLAERWGRLRGGVAVIASIGEEHPRMLGAVLVLCAFGAWNCARQPELYDWSNMPELMIEVARDGKLADHGCILLVNHYWIWTYGEFIQGRSYDAIEVKPEQLTPRHLAVCSYAVVLPSSAPEFERRAGAAWARRLESHWGYLLYAKL